MASIEPTMSEIDAAIEKATGPLGTEIGLLQQIPGVGKKGAIGTVAEIGVDMQQFPDQKHIGIQRICRPLPQEQTGT